MPVRRQVVTVRRRRPAPAFWAALGLALLIGWRVVASRGTSAAVQVDQEQVQVVRAVDGDTLLLADGRRVRLLGVDTPETKHPQRPAEPFGEEASRFTQSRTAGRTVRLEYDRERLDNYGRWLAYVYLGDDCLNELLIQEGFSKAEIAFPFRSDMQRRFLNAEQQARAASRGLWGPPAEASKSSRPRGTSR